MLHEVGHVSIDAVDADRQVGVEVDGQIGWAGIQQVWEEVHQFQVETSIEIFYCDVIHDQFNPEKWYI